MLAYIRFSALLWTFFIGGALSAPRSVSSPRDIRSKREALPTTTPNPCGSIVDDVNDGYAYHYASDAFACLTSVPFNPAVATRFIKYVNDTIQFQSTIDYLKEPPAGYQQPAVDIPSELARIQYNVKTRAYSNQYQFELDIKRLLYSAHDGHLYLSGGVTAAFSFLAPYSITSASSDGKNVPEVFITDDIIKSKKEGWKPSPIKMINNEVAEDYLTKFASLNAFGGIEPHADWNQLFFTPALTIQSSGSIWDSNVAFYPGDVLEITLENGTEYIDPWLALWTEPFPTGPLTTGGDMYNYFALGLLPASYKVNGTDFNPAYNSSGQAKPSVREETWSSISYGAYPQPEVWQADPNFYKYGSAAGFINPSFSVLSIPSFVQYGKSIGNFSGAVSNFISGALEAKTNKVIIDLQQNRGGTVELAFSTFKRFFPDEEPFAGSRRRKHQLGDIIGEAYTAYFNKLRTTDDEYQNYLADEWVATTRLNAATDQNFSSWAELSSFESGDKSHSSAVERFNISNYEYAAALFEGWVPRGYTFESPLPSTITPFKPENIIILTDGACASTCALMVEMFKQVGVRTVAVGGRPEKGPMQAVGVINEGTRGAAIYSADQIDMHIRKLRTESFGMREQDLAILPLLTEAGYRDPGVYSRVMAVNLRDQVRLNDTIPLQFKYEAAHCRIFYTLKNVWNMTQLWQDVSTASEDVSLCVGGSTRYTDADEPPPAPMAVQEIAWNVNMSEPDAFLIDEDFDLNGGPQGCLVFGNCVLGEFKPQHCTESGGCNNAAQQCIEYVSIEGCSGIQDVSVRRCVGRATPLVCEKFPNFVFDTTWQNDVDVLGFGSLAPRKTVILGPKPGFHAMEVNFRSNKRTLKESGFCRPKPGKDSRCP